MPVHSRNWSAYLLALVLSGAQAAPEADTVPANSIAIIYPEAGAAFHDVFSSIIEGIAEVTKGRAQNYVVAANPDMEDLNVRFKRHGIKVVIALGRQGFKAASALSPDITVVAGAILTLPETEHRVAGISLSPDPALLFTKLAALQPQIKRVFVIYDPQQNEWLITLAREAAKAQRLELVTRQAANLASAARLYEAILASADPHEDAIWLPPDSTTVNENTILPMVLRASWERTMMVFSSTLLHAKKGVLFALYPNNRELGRHLASSALGILAGEPNKGIAPLRAVETAINIRTASHLGMNLTYQRRMAETFFPKSQ